MQDSIRAHLRDSFQRRLHPEIVQQGDCLRVRIEVARLRLPQNKITEAQRKHVCCRFDQKHLIMEGDHEHLCECISFLAQSEVNPGKPSSRNDRRKRPRSAVR